MNITEAFQGGPAHPGIIAAVITAAGSSSRMGAVKKEYRPLGGELDRDGRPLSVLAKAALAFAACPRIDLAVITVPTNPALGELAARKVLPRRILEPDFRPRFLFVAGGPTRRSSVHHALTLLDAYNPSFVLIHDGARPWTDPSLIDQVIDTTLEHGAAIPLLPLTDTPKEIDDSGFIKRHLRRAMVGGAQTPQGFAFPEILSAHEEAAKRERWEGRVYTDDAEIWGEFVGPVAAVTGSLENRKITFPEDLEMLPTEIMEPDKLIVND
ncbi:MAG: 2-C-methyl-D-erythritol 4-phosphate cytidylyltransferase [Treponema sp.]|jgi:2-C-methyl-D-erythritol 4-phosphate cytidylyltransferase/2-C-methyl-D-erythritol 4-phosphate cytidylyltransferase/2-C-methyl-D-erythritol 2,4-cyclodiphosphate synthase|nr:2-C-methyl-D-erythritol 4-phosphate cytidylyltransferase [Treponema sp.]